MLTYEDCEAIAAMAWDALCYIERHGAKGNGGEGWSTEMACETLGRIIHKVYPDGLLATEQVAEYVR